MVLIRAPIYVGTQGERGRDHPFPESQTGWWWGETGSPCKSRAEREVTSPGVFTGPRGLGAGAVCRARWEPPTGPPGTSQPVPEPAPPRAPHAPARARSRRRKCCVVHFRVLSGRRRASRVSRPPPGSWSQERRHRHGGHQRWAWGAGRGGPPGVAGGRPGGRARGLGRGRRGDDPASAPPAGALRSWTRAEPGSPATPSAVREFAPGAMEGCDREGCPARHIGVVCHPRQERGPLRSLGSCLHPLPGSRCTIFPFLASTSDAS